MKDSIKQVKEFHELFNQPVKESFEGGTQRKKSFIHDVCQFPRFYNNYTNQRRNCIEIILMSKGMSAKEQRRYVDIDPFASAKITLKDLTLKSL